MNPRSTQRSAGAVAVVPGGASADTQRADAWARTTSRVAGPLVVTRPALGSGVFSQCVQRESSRTDEATRPTGTGLPTARHPDRRRTPCGWVWLGNLRTSTNVARSVVGSAPKTAWTWSSTASRVFRFDAVAVGVPVGDLVEEFRSLRCEHVGSAFHDENEAVVQGVHGVRSCIDGSVSRSYSIRVTSTLDDQNQSTQSCGRSCNDLQLLLQRTAVSRPAALLARGVRRVEVRKSEVFVITGERRSLERLLEDGELACKS